jgi:hypothetical protein
VPLARLGATCRKDAKPNFKKLSDHFLATLSRVPNGTVLLFDGTTVTKEIYNSGLSVEQEGGGQLINIRTDRGRIRKLKFGKKTFPFRS